MNLMIVEDELRLLNNIARNIPWEEHEIEVVATADNGVDAIKLFDQAKPNIVLLDIQMPDLDGLSVARHIAEADPLAKIIFLSGHDDFKYAQTAIELQVAKYLLKPAGNDEVLQAVLEAREKIREDLDAKYNHELVRKRWAEHLPRLQDLFFQNWLSGKYAEWEIEQRSRELMIDLPGGAGWAVSVADPDPLTAPNPRFSPEDMTLLQISMLGIAKEFLANVPCHIFSDDEGATVIVFRDASDERERRRSVGDFTAHVHLHTTRLLSVFKEYMKTSASAGIGRVADKRTNVSRSYLEAGQALKERVVHGHDIVVPYRDEPAASPAGAADVQLEKVLAHALESGQRETATALIDEWLEAHVDRAHTSEEVYENVLLLASLIVRVVHFQGWPLQEAMGRHLAFFQQLRALTTKEQTRQWLYGTVDHICAYVNDRKSKSRHELIEKMIGMVEADIGQDIGLHEVAGKLYINASYLSRLFKQQMGQSFTAYVVERKMKLAMQWLSDGMKVSDTANMLGYRDFSYFAKVFRKTWGVTPAEVKNKKAMP
ncbi:two-component system, response regulator YesN [Cohnella sp. OV330]|uniref:response regulator n=1 Tax=Cohnella sp. OV330 TaxID=1855288 RepID=UPI0008F270AB|nr:response regulator [Cohnella sp. OV330]SFB14323.1 two-component system, response regulator YesN [Cohnella sp. OV330]